MNTDEQLEARLDTIQDNIVYLREQIDKLRDQLHSLVWKVAGLGAGSSAIGFLVALYVNKLI